MRRHHIVFCLGASGALLVGCEDKVLVRRDRPTLPTEPERQGQYASCGSGEPPTPTNVPLVPAEACPASLPLPNAPCFDAASCVSVSDAADAGWAAECVGSEAGEGIWLVYRGVAQPAGDTACGDADVFGSSDDFRLRFAEGKKQGSFAYEATDASVFLRRRGGRFFFAGEIGSLDDGGSLALTQASLDEATCTLTLAANGDCVGSRGQCSFTGSVAISLVPDVPRTATFRQACAGPTGGERTGGVLVGYW